ncbi:hypothetical protein QR680_010264 [Steinernema hermaphroditum]|uniref:Uncharacterized protein n=1 Tax=Steinernema hermaphroditum TaxID=289476 RepID=A0AA39IND2_9BILA|nr:hypothetical protein QR680_010264 [Steinernema hermaphroditum]
MCPHHLCFLLFCVVLGATFPLEGLSVKSSSTENDPSLTSHHVLVHENETAVPSHPLITQESLTVKIYAICAFLLIVLVVCVVCLIVAYVNGDLARCVCSFRHSK